jgi:hypothetical protein
MVLFASGQKVRDVARIIGCDAKTLRKVFPQEVKRAADAELLLRSGMMAKLIDGAEAGNVAAMRQLDKMLAAEKTRQLAKSLPADRREKAEKLGKKEEAKAAAGTLTGKFGQRPPPRLFN